MLPIMLRGLPLTLRGFENFRDCGGVGKVFSRRLFLIVSPLVIVGLTGLSYFRGVRARGGMNTDDPSRVEYGSAPPLVEPYATPSVQNVSRVIGWPRGRTPVAPEGFQVTKLADNFISPRNIYIAPDGDIFVA